MTEKITKGYTIPLIDLDKEKHRQIIVDKEKDQYLGHPTTVLLNDNKTIYTVYPQGHGRGQIIMKKSEDGGLTWSDRLSTPDNWSTSHEVPTIFKLKDAKGIERLFVFSGLYPIRMSVSEDNGESWSELEAIGDFGGVVTMSEIVSLNEKGHYMALFHDDGRFINGGENEHWGSPAGEKDTLKVYKSVTKDGGLTWNNPEVIAEHPEAELCEPGAVRSPDGKEIAVLMRENTHQLNSFVMFSRDEGKSWTEPKELPGSLTGDRHVCRYTKDGRLIVVFRDLAKISPTKGDFVVWVGEYSDLVEGNEGQYRIRLKENKDSWDSTYAGVEVLADNTIVATTYGHWEKGEEPFIISVRFKLEEMDKKVELSPEYTDVFVNGKSGYNVYRVPSIIKTKAGTLLAFSEGRKSKNDHANNDIVLKRSIDSGNTWSEIKVIAKHGDNCLNNPTPVEIRENGRIILMYQYFPNGYHEREVVPGYEGDKICRTYIIYSDDNGKSWSQPEEITKSVKREKKVTSVATGPGIGLQIRNGKYTGRIVFPFNQGPWGEWKLYAVYSDDLGESWKYGELVSEDSPGTGNEVQIVELSNGDLMINSRSYNGSSCRKTAISKDGGQSWSSLVDEPGLIEPECQGSILRFGETTASQKSRILFSNPASKEGRINGTVRVSYDEGKSWTTAKNIYAGSFDYSCLTVLPDMSIGCLFERDNVSKITFAKFSLEWLESENE